MYTPIRLSWWSLILFKKPFGPDRRAIALGLWAAYSVGTNRAPAEQILTKNGVLVGDEWPEEFDMSRLIVYLRIHWRLDSG